SDKKYHRFTGYIGNLKTETLSETLQRHPERVSETRVKGMLPKNPLGRAMFKKRKVYRGPEHPHAAQQPQVLEIETTAITQNNGTGRRKSSTARVFLRQGSGNI